MGLVGLVATVAVAVASLFVTAWFSSTALAQDCGICADANGDGKVDIADALFIAQKTVGLRAELPCPMRADANNSGLSDIVDALFVGQFTVGSRPLLCIQVDTPEPLALFGEPATTVTGSVVGEGDASCNGRSVSRNGDQFSVDLTLREGRNTITCSASGGQELDLLTTSRQVTVDMTPPLVSIESPKNGAVITSLQTDIVGLVNDLATGTTTNADDCSVMVNGVEASVSNQSFMVSNFLLQPGANTITVKAIDRAGNEGTTSIIVNAQGQSGQRLVLVSGSGQVGRVRTELSEPLVVQALDDKGDSVAEQTVKFAVSRGDGFVSASPEQGAELETTTDEHGLARVFFTLGGRTGEGNNRVMATAPGYLGQPEFCAIGTVGEPQRITAVSGGGQVGPIGEALPAPFVVLVTDLDGNPVPDVDVTFDVTQGGGTIGGETSVEETTDLDGLAGVILTLGAEEGIDNNVVVADFPALTEAPASFSASGQLKGDVAETAVSGLVLDNQDNPVPGATVEVHQEGVVLFPVPGATTDAEGQFTIVGPPIGPVRLIVDGSTTSRDGDWPVIEFDLVVIAGQDNALGRPIYLPVLDMDSSVVVQNGGPPEDVTLQMAGVPGTELTILAHSVTCPLGNECQISWTQINTQKVPMSAPMGSAFMVAGTLQPAGTIFDPPASICIPNNGLPVGQQVEVFSFDHDLGEFVAAGTATASEKGQLCSDSGFGISKAGWHGCVPPPPPCNPTCGGCKSDECTTRTGVVNGCGCDCSVQFKPEGTSCSDDGITCTADQCDGSGGCVHPPNDDCECVDDSECDDGEDCTTESCGSNGTCEYQNLADGSECAADKFCTMGECVGGACHTQPVDDQNEISDTTTVSFPKLVKFIRDASSVLADGPPCSPDFTFSTTLTELDTCCESRDQFLPLTKGELGGQLAFSCSFKTPGGIPVGPTVVRGLFSFGGAVGANATLQAVACTDKMNGWSGTGFFRGTVGGGVSVEPLIPGGDKIVSLKGVISGGGGCEIQFLKQNAKCPLMLAPIVGTIEVEFLNGLISKAVSVVIYRWGGTHTIVQPLPTTI